MGIRMEAILQLTQIYDARDLRAIVRCAKDQDRLESAWVNKMRSFIKSLAREIIDRAAKVGSLDAAWIDFEPIIVEHSFAVMHQAIKSTKRLKPVPKTRKARLAEGPPPADIPADLRQLRREYDLWRKKKIVPIRQRALANRIKREFFRRLQNVWLDYSIAFRTGQVGQQKEAITQVMKQADVVFSRAKMIVETETTYYYNRTRRQVYDQSDDVTHYLFVALRDHATTKWCKSRHGLVYAKTLQILKRETPPIHWNCRSELLPLTPQNPRHLKLIKSASRRRNNNRAEPLPKEWIAR